MITFSNSNGGSWDTPANWDLNRVPALGDDVVIPDLPGTKTVTYSSSSTTVTSVAASEQLTIAGTLEVTSTIASTAPVLLSGGNLKKATVNSGTNFSASGGTLDGVTVNGDWSLGATSYAALSIRNGLTLNGTLTLGSASGASSGSLNFNDTQILTGNGTVILAGANVNNGLSVTSSGQPSPSPPTLTIGAGITVRGHTGMIGFNGATTNTFVNQGPARMETAAKISGYLNPSRAAP